MVAPPVAAGQDRSPTPSAEELWRTYPLQQTPEPSKTLTPTASARPAESPQVPDDGPPLPVIGAAGVLLLLAGGLAALRIRSRPPTIPRPMWAAPLMTTAAATAMLPDHRSRSPRLTALADGPRPGGRPDDGMRPPDPRRAWTAEVEWSGSRFAVTARAGDRGAGVRVATSGPLRWPPADAEAVRVMREAVEELEASLLATGWTALPPGSAWYARRFAWAGTAPSARPSPASESVTALPGADAPPASGRFKRQAEWPAGTEELWRCEIKWHAGYMNSSFRAVAHGPKRLRGVTLGHSEVFKWLLKGEPESEDAQYTTQVRQLAERLAAAGWEPAGRGRDWYELRFVWRREGMPPDELAPVPTEATR